MRFRANIQTKYWNSISVVKHVCILAERQQYKYTLNDILIKNKSLSFFINYDLQKLSQEIIIYWETLFWKRVTDAINRLNKKLSIKLKVSDSNYTVCHYYQPIGSEVRWKILLPALRVDHTLTYISFSLFFDTSISIRSVYEFGNTRCNKMQNSLQGW